MLKAFSCRLNRVFCDFLDGNFSEQMAAHAKIEYCVRRTNLNALLSLIRPMRRFFLLLGLLVGPFVSFVSPGSGIAHAKKYTLRELCTKVATEYPGVLAARHSLRASESLYKQARYSWMPTGDFSAFFTGNYDACKNDEGKAADCSEDHRSVKDHINGVSYGIDLNILQPIYTFGKIEAATGAAKAGIQASVQGIEAAKQDAVYNAIRAYWGLKWARAAKLVVEEGTTKLKEWIDKIAEELDGANKGNYTEADLARMKAALDGAELVLVDIQRGLTVALVGLQILTDDKEADIDDEELQVAAAAEQSLEYFEDAALRHRPETKMLEASVVAAKAFRKWRIADLLPTIGFRLTLSYRNYATVEGGLSALVQFSPLSSGIPVPMLVLNQPLDFGVRGARYMQADAEARVAEERRRQALGGIAVEVASAYANYDEARTRESKLSHAEKVARGWYVIVGHNMSQGLTVSTDARELTDAARTYFDFRIRHLQAIMDTNLTLAWLKRTTGME